MTLKAFITDSALTQGDKDLWFSILDNLDNEQIKIFEDFVDNGQERLLFLTNNLKAKKEAFQKGNEKDLEKILQEEADV